MSVEKKTPPQSAGQMEERISEAMVQFEREHMGRGPTRTRTYIIGDLVLVRIEGVLTQAELLLAKEIEGVKLLKEVRQKLIENARGVLAATMERIIGREVVSMHSDISARVGERIIVFTLAEPI